MTGREGRRGPASPLADLDRRIGRLDLTRWPRVARPLLRAAHRLAGRLGLYWSYVLPLAIGAGVFAAGIWAFGDVYEGVQEQGDIAVLDVPALRLAVALRTPPLVAAAIGLSLVGGTVVTPVLAALIVALLTVVRRTWTPALVIVPAALGSLVMTLVGKRIVGRSRPPMADAVPPYEPGASFPSGHSLNAIVIAGAIAYVLLLRRRTGAGRTTTIALAAVYALGVGLTRVYLGHHWLTDVVAAWVLGAAWLAVVITAHRLLLTVRRSRAPA